MKQNKSELQGAGKVFQFTFLQFAKNKANMITLIIMLVIALFSVPVTTLFSGGGISAGDSAEFQRYTGRIRRGILSTWKKRQKKTTISEILPSRRQRSPSTISNLPGRRIPYMCCFQKMRRPEEP